MSCEQELCVYWTGQGCACDVLDIDEVERRAGEWGQTIDPEPVECPDCLGDRTEKFWDGRTHQTRHCSTCHGEGVVEDAT